MIAGLAAHAPVSLSVADALPAPLGDAIAAAGVEVRVEDDLAWLARVRDLRDARVRLVGGSAAALLEAIGGRCDVTVFDGAVTEAGRAELLPFLREQAVSITAHRFGTPSPLAHVLPPSRVESSAQRTYRDPRDPSRVE